VQYSSGCPYQCEFCDIPALYGRNARLKTPAQVTAELDKMLACGLSGAVYFVDDNFIANRRAVRDLLPALVEWQKRNGYAYAMSCEATLNIAKRPEILELMREAYFVTVFCGIETPDPQALKEMQKDHNLMVPILEGIETLNTYGIEVVSGIIMGLDTDRPDTGERIIEFIETSQIPLLTINLLQALPRTPLYDRLKLEGRLIEDEDGRESNVAFRMDYDEMLAMWRDVMGRAFSPATVFGRYQHQVEATYPNRLKPPNSRQRLSWPNIRRGLTIFTRVLWHVGVRADYRRDFWRFAWPRLKSGDIEAVIRVGMLSYHMILSGREAAAGHQSASHYTSKPHEITAAAAAA